MGGQRLGASMARQEPVNGMDDFTCSRLLFIRAALRMVVQAFSLHDRTG